MAKNEQMRFFEPSLAELDKKHHGIDSKLCSEWVLPPIGNVPTCTLSMNTESAFAFAAAAFIFHDLPGAGTGCAARLQRPAPQSDQRPDQLPYGDFARGGAASTWRRQTLWIRNSFGCSLLFRIRAAFPCTDFSRLSGRLRRAEHPSPQGIAYVQRQLHELVRRLLTQLNLHSQRQGAGRQSRRPAPRFFRSHICNCRQLKRPAAPPRL